ncbi:hypothetical protein [Undibacterium sp. CY21W]|uniref:hypothetical protein n=1 Tax=Undibacterium sp. CY21W TaxID=2762293 RepID=UPI00164B631C|nr:hypothetical protein [Undibacterium sp. CY21W]MBC3927486.1 hypothetical protein [Undibacterium sp. CY21W]
MLYDADLRRGSSNELCSGKMGLGGLLYYKTQNKFAGERKGNTRETKRKKALEKIKGFSNSKGAVESSSKTRMNKRSKIFENATWMQPWMQKYFLTLFVVINAHTI